MEYLFFGKFCKLPEGKYQEKITLVALPVKPLNTLLSIGGVLLAGSPKPALVKMNKLHEQEILTALGQRIKSERLKKGLNQVELAKSCNMEKASLSRIESGKTNVTLRTLNNLATALEVAFLDLFTHGES